MECITGRNSSITGDVGSSGLPASVTQSGCTITGAITDTTVTLDAQGDANAIWIFKVGTGGTGALTGTNLSVVLTNGAQPCNVSWWVAEAATLTTSGFQGTILAGAAITMTGLTDNPIAPFNVARKRKRPCEQGLF